MRVESSCSSFVCYLKKKYIAEITLRLENFILKWKFVFNDLNMVEFDRTLAGNEKGITIFLHPLDIHFGYLFLVVQTYTHTTL